MSKPIRTGTVGGIPVTVADYYVLDDGALRVDRDGGRVIVTSQLLSRTILVHPEDIVLDPLPEPDPPRFFVAADDFGSVDVKSRDHQRLVATYWGNHPDALAAANAECARLLGDTPEPSARDLLTRVERAWACECATLPNNDSGECYCDEAKPEPSCSTCGDERTVDDSCGGDSGCTYRKPCPACTPDPLPLADWTVGEARPSLVRLGWWFAYIGPEVGGDPMAIYGRTPDLAAENARWLLDRLRQQEVE